jgi:hypothetical protein
VKNFFCDSKSTHKAAIFPDTPAFYYNLDVKNYKRDAFYYNLDVKNYKRDVFYLYKDVKYIAI